MKSASLLDYFSGLLHRLRYTQTAIKKNCKKVFLENRGSDLKGKC